MPRTESYAECPTKMDCDLKISSTPDLFMTGDKQTDPASFDCHDATVCSCKADLVEKQGYRSIHKAVLQPTYWWASCRRENKAGIKWRKWWWSWYGVEDYPNAKLFQSKKNGLKCNKELVILRCVAGRFCCLRIFINSLQVLPQIEYCVTRCYAPSQHYR